MLLNPVLYATMLQQFGPVKIVKPGYRGEDPIVMVNPATHAKQIVWRKGADKGEEYQCCCPFCNDYGFHLYVNHRYGLDKYTGRRIKLAQCFKGCLEDPANREKLYSILVYGRSACLNRDTIERLRAMTSPQEYTPVAVSLPKSVIPLSSLPNDHPAVVHVLSRGYERDVFDTYDLLYCDSQDDYMTRNRLIIPVRMEGKLVMWQARKLDDAAYGPKYYTSPGVHKGNILYNFDIAAQQPFVVVTEGPTDAWRIGYPGVCLFGKVLSEGQRELLLRTWQGKPILIMLDNDAKDASQRIVQELSSVHDGGVAMVEFPEVFKDPGSVPPDIVVRAVTKALWSIS